MPAVMSVLAAAVLLGSAHLAYSFYMKRELQNAADFAAVAGARTLASQPDACAAAIAAARASAAQNLQAHGAPADQGVDVECGRWDPEQAQAPRHWIVGGAPSNAVRVMVARTLDPIAPFMPPQQVRVEAVAAADEPMAAFWVGSNLLRVSSNGLLGRLLAGVGVNPNALEVLTSSGLANLSVTPAGLLEALGIPVTAAVQAGSGQALADVTRVTLGSLLDAYATVLSQNEGAQAAISALDGLVSALRVGVLDGTPMLQLPVSLLGEGGIFANVDLADGTSALSVDANALDLVAASLALATGDHLVDMPVLNVAGLVQGKLRIVEPPQIAIGPVGTRAHSAQVRLYLHVSTSGVPLLGGLLDLLGTKVDLPLIVEVGSSEAELVSLCEAPLARNQAELAVTSAAARLCVGGFPGMESDPSLFFAEGNSCSAPMTSHKVFDVLGLLPVRPAPLRLPVLDSGVDTVQLTAPDPGEPPQAVTVIPDDNIDLARLGETLVADIGGALLDSLIGAPAASGLEGGTLDERVDRLFGSTPFGRSLSEISAELRYSNEALQHRARQWSSGQLLTALLGSVNDLLQTILIAPLGDTVCGLTGALGGAKAARACKRPYVEDLVSGSNGITAILGLLVRVLEPVLDGLSALLQQVVNTAGLNLGSTDVALMSVRCGQPRLVY